MKLAGEGTNKPGNSRESLLPMYDTNKTRKQIFQSSNANDMTKTHYMSCVSSKRPPGRKAEHWRFTNPKAGTGSCIVARRSSSLAYSQCDTFLVLFARVNSNNAPQPSMHASSSITSPHFLFSSFPYPPSISHHDTSLSCLISSCHYPVSLSINILPVTCWRHQIRP